ncbi:hypothetical protein [Qipengyuania sp. JC766]|uniref:DUF7674 family protein n=1 Tax=Qipengyuania sp. JC766 TaxID=3232139 RepID=UPI00345982A4
MICRADLVSEIRNTDPRFEPIVEQFLKEWSNEADEGALPEYLLFAEISRVIAEDIRTGNRAPLPKIFAMIERLHIDGDDHVREAATVGLLEDIQTQLLLSNTGWHLAHPYLGSESKRWWDKLFLLWNAGQYDALHED